MENLLTALSNANNIIVVLTVLSIGLIITNLAMYSILAFFTHRSADEIESLKAENETLKKENESYKIVFYPNPISDITFAYSRFTKPNKESQCK